MWPLPWPVFEVRSLVFKGGRPGRIPWMSQRPVPAHRFGPGCGNPLLLPTPPTPLKLRLIGGNEMKIKINIQM